MIQFLSQYLVIALNFIGVSMIVVALSIDIFLEKGLMKFQEKLIIPFKIMKIKSTKLLCQVTLACPQRRLQS